MACDSAYLPILNHGAIRLLEALLGVIEHHIAQAKLKLNKATP